MALDRLTKITGPGIKTDTNWVGNNANYTGIITAASFSGDGSGLIGVASTDNIVTGTAATFNTYPVDINAGMTVAGVATFAGNVSIAGTLTYEDVTNIDSVGIITGKGADINGDLDVDGHTNLDNVSVAGVTTFNANVKFDGANAGRDITFERSQNSLVFADDALAKFGNSEDFKLFHDGSNSYIRETGTGSLVLQSNETKIVNSANNETIAKFNENSSVELYHDDNLRLTTSTKGIQVGTGVTIETNGQATFVGVVTFGSGSTTIDDNVVNVGTALTLGHTQGVQFHTQNLHAQGFEVNQINASGIITATTFKGDGDFVDLDVDGHTELDNARISGITTVSGEIRKPYGTYHPMLTIRNAAAGSAALRIDNWSNNTNEKRINISHNFNRLSSAFAADDSSIGCASIAFEDGEIRFGTSAAGTNNSQTRFKVDSSGHFIPNADSTFDIGTNSVRVRNVYADTLYGDGSNLTGITQTTINNNGSNRIITGSSTANTLEGEATFTYDGVNKAKIDTSQTYAMLQLDGSSGGAIEFYDDATRKFEIYGIDAGIEIYDREKGAYHSKFLSGGDLEVSDGKVHIKGSGELLRLQTNASGGGQCYIDFDDETATRASIGLRGSSSDTLTLAALNGSMRFDVSGKTQALQLGTTGNIQHDAASGVSYFKGSSEYIFGSNQSSPSSGGNEGDVQIHTSKSRASFSINGYQNNAGAPFMQFISSRSGTVGTLGGVANNNDYLGDIRFCGDDGAGGVATGATIQVRAKTSATTNGMAARIEFATAKDSSSTTRQVFSMNEGGALTAESESPALYGYYTSVNNGNHYVDFPQWTRDSFTILEIFGNVNPNSAGGGYVDPLHMYVYKGTGWTGSRQGHYIYSVSVAPPARHAFPSGTGYSGNAQVSAVWTDGSSNLGNETGTSTNYMRLLIPNANNTYSFPKQFRIFRRR
jgi:hypothetical protein